MRGNTSEFIIGAYVHYLQQLSGTKVTIASGTGLDDAQSNTPTIIHFRFQWLTLHSP
jgi:hypothetical protein